MCKIAKTGGGIVTTKTTIKIWVEAENHYSAKLQAESLYGRNNVVSAPMLVRN